MAYNSKHTGEDIESILDNIDELENAINGGSFKDYPESSYIQWASDISHGWAFIAELPYATTSSAGAMSAADKEKVDNIPTNYTSSQCTTYTSDTGTCTPAAVKQAVTKFGITKDSLQTAFNSAEYSDEDSDGLNFKTTSESGWSIQTMIPSVTETNNGVLSSTYFSLFKAYGSRVLSIEKHIKYFGIVVSASTSLPSTAETITLTTSTNQINGCAVNKVIGRILVDNTWYNITCTEYGSTIYAEAMGSDISFQGLHTNGNTLTITNDSFVIQAIEIYESV